MSTPAVFTVESRHLSGRPGALFEVGCEELALNFARERGITHPSAEWVEWATRELLSQVEQGLVGKTVESPHEWRATEALLAELDNPSRTSA